MDDKAYGRLCRSRLGMPNRTHAIRSDGSQYDAETTAFIMGMDRMKRETGIQNPDAVTVLRWAKLLGYAKTT